MIFIIGMCFWVLLLLSIAANYSAYRKSVLNPWRDITDFLCSFTFFTALGLTIVGTIHIAYQILTKWGIQ